MAATPPVRIPTIDDLRVKLCYICQEEEVVEEADTVPSSLLPGRPRTNRPIAWVHPCKCTLIAHEKCLLKWIRTAQATRGASAMKCAQCGTRYELESDNPLALRVMQACNAMMQAGGGLFMMFGAATVVGVVGTSIYVVCTGYGAWALQRFIGREMYDLLLGDDPSNWPWSAYINLPLLPFSLIISRFQGSSIPPIVPILLALPSSFSPALTRKVNEYWRLPENAMKLIGLGPDPIDELLTPGKIWPPSPLLFGLFGLPLVRMAYMKVYQEVFKKVLGAYPPERVTWRRGNRENADLNNADNGAGAGDDDDARRNDLVPARMNIRDGPFGINIRANIREEVRDENGRRVGNPENENERVLEINAASVGRRVAGALITPAVASWMGNLLLRFSHRSTWLREFLAVRQPLGAVWVPPPLNVDNRELHSLTAIKQVTVGLQAIARGLWGSSRTFLESDPVWWRNSVGLGLFIVAKDAVQLFYLYLAKRELETRRVKSRDFGGVDIQALDLIHPTLFGLPRPAS